MFCLNHPYLFFWNMTRDYSWVTITLLFAAVLNTNLETRNTIDTSERHQTEVHGKTIWVPPNLKLLLYARISYHAHLILGYFPSKDFLQVSTFLEFGKQYHANRSWFVHSTSSNRNADLNTRKKLVDDPSPFATDWNCIYSYFEFVERICQYDKFNIPAM